MEVNVTVTTVWLEILAVMSLQGLACEEEHCRTYTRVGWLEK